MRILSNNQRLNGIFILKNRTKWNQEIYYMHSKRDIWLYVALTTQKNILCWGTCWVVASPRCLTIVVSFTICNWCINHVLCIINETIDRELCKSGESQSWACKLITVFVCTIPRDINFWIAACRRCISVEATIARTIFTSIIIYASRPVAKIAAIIPGNTDNFSINYANNSWEQWHIWRSSGGISIAIYGGININVGSIGWSGIKMPCLNWNILIIKSITWNKEGLCSSNCNSGIMIHGYVINNS